MGLKIVKPDHMLKTHLKSVQKELVEEEERSKKREILQERIRVMMLKKQ